MKHFATRRPPKQKLLLFARVPEAGLVKTRLARELGSERALVLYRAMLTDVLQSVGPSSDDIDVEVMWTGSDAVNGAMLREAFDDRTLSRQTGETLGDRLAIAFSERIFFHACEKVIAIGVDDPALPRPCIEKAFDLLESCEWVLGPAADGGYYLIGCRGAAYDSSVFTGVDWGTDRVARQTDEKIRALGATVATLPCRRDIDVRSDLRDYSALPDGSALKNVLEEWGWSE